MLYNVAVPLLLASSAEPPSQTSELIEHGRALLELDDVLTDIVSKLDTDLFVGQSWERGLTEAETRVVEERRLALLRAAERVTQRMLLEWDPLVWNEGAPPSL